MSLRAGVGFSKQLDVGRAAREAVELARSQLPSARVDAVLMFACLGHDQPALLQEVRRLTDRAPLIGCSGPGLITNGHSHEDMYGVQVTLLQLEGIRATPAYARGCSQDSRGVGRSIGDTIARAEVPDGRVVLCFVDGLNTAFAQFRAGLEERLGQIPMIGGLAGDPFEFVKTLQYFDDEVLTDGAVALMLSGDLEVVSGVTHGAVPVGEQLAITRADPKVVYEVDGKPAYEAWQQYMDHQEEGEGAWGRMAMIVTMGFEMEDPEIGTRTVLRWSPSADPATGAVRLGNEIPDGATAFRMMRRDAETMEAENQRLVSEIQKRAGGRDPSLVMMFDCGGRGRLYLPEAEKNRLLSQMKGVLGTNTAWAGLHTFGEIGPIKETNAVHNHSAVVCALYDR